jgi:hypothetical protein
MAIAIETVIYMILAVVVLSVLLSIFLGSDPYRALLEEKRINACSGFSELSGGKCDSSAFAEITQSRPALYESLEVCKKFDAYKDKCASLDFACVVDCCHLLCFSK